MTPRGTVDAEFGRSSRALMRGTGGAPVPGTDSTVLRSCANAGDRAGLLIPELNDEEVFSLGSAAGDGAAPRTHCADRARGSPRCLREVILTLVFRQGFPRDLGPFHRVGGRTGINDTVGMEFVGLTPRPDGAHTSSS